MIRVALTPRGIIFAATHPAGEPPSRELAEAVAKLGAALDAAGIRYTAREYEATATPRRQERQRTRRKVRKAGTGSKEISQATIEACAPPSSPSPYPPSPN